MREMIEIYNAGKNPVDVSLQDGATAIYNVLDSVCQEGIRNGGIAPGQLSEALRLDVIRSTGNTDFDGFLPNGYLIYIPPFTEQSDPDRNARLSTPPKVWMKGSGAIHRINGAFVFNN